MNPNLTWMLEIKLEGLPDFETINHQERTDLIIGLVLMDIRRDTEEETLAEDNVPCVIRHYDRNTNGVLYISFSQLKHRSHLLNNCTNLFIIID